MVISVINETTPTVWKWAAALGAGSLALPLLLCGSLLPLSSPFSRHEDLALLIVVGLLADPLNVIEFKRQLSCECIYCHCTLQITVHQQWLSNFQA